MNAEIAKEVWKPEQRLCLTRLLFLKKYVAQVLLKLSSFITSCLGVNAYSLVQSSC